MTPEQRYDLATKSRKVAIISFVLFLCFATYVILFADDNVCVTVPEQPRLAIDVSDLGTKCFRTLSESKNYSAYLLEKYNVSSANSDDFFNLEGLNVSFD